MYLVRSNKLTLRKCLVRKLSTLSCCWRVQSALMTLVFIVCQLAFVTVQSPRLVAARLTRLTIVSRLLMPVTLIFSISCSSSVSGRSTTTTATRVATTSGCRCSQRDANVHTRTVNQSKGNRHWHDCSTRGFNESELPQYCLEISGCKDSQSLQRCLAV